jgi:hypothetical protein
MLHRSNDLGATAAPSPRNKTPIVAAGEICRRIVGRKTVQSTALLY